VSEFKLCYVDLPWCFFTTKELSEQWGDDWNDAPYGHNAGEPYQWRDDGTPRFEIKKISIDAGLEQPCDGHLNSSYSVEMINRGDVAWLKTPRYEKKQIEIMAGTSLDRFIELVKEAGGKIYIESVINQPRPSAETDGRGALEAT
jgi:hypothetical protein